MPSRCLPPSTLTRVLGACAVLTGLAAIPSALHAADYQWDSVAIGGGGFVSALIPSQTEPGLLYARTDVGGAYRWAATAATWIPLNDWTRREDVEVTTTPSGNGISFVTLDPSSGDANTTQTLYVGVSREGDNLYRSTDGGATFTLVAGGPAGFMPQRGVLAPNGALHLTYGNGAGPHPTGSFDFNQGGIWKLDTSDDSWSDITPSGFSNAFGGISVDPANPDRIIASSINLWRPQDNAFGDRFFLSNDGGASWTDLVERGFDLDPNGITWIDGQSIHWAGSIEFDPFDTNIAWVTSGNGIYRCDDLSATESVWKFAVRGLEETVPLDLVSIPDGPLVSVIGDYDGFRHTEPKAYAPVHRPGMGTTTGLAFATAEPQWIYRAGDSLYYSQDYGLTWTESASMNGAKGSLALSADAAVLLHCPENSTTTYRSTDQGSSWSTVGRGIAFGEPVLDSIAYADWSALVFTEAQRADPEIAGEEADPDGDGLPNLLEWILQTDPLASTDLAARTFAFSAAAPRIAFQQLAEFNSATLVVEISTDLQSWSAIASQFTEEAAAPAANSPTRTRIFSPASGAFPETLFLRFTATR